MRAHLAGVLALGACLAACGTLAPSPGSRNTTTPPSRGAPPLDAGSRPSALVAALDCLQQPAAVGLARQVIAASARNNEHLTVLVGSHVLTSGTSPAKKADAPDPPPPVLARDATTYQKSKYHHAMDDYRREVTAHQAQARAARQADFASWVARMIAPLRSHTASPPCPTAAPLGLVAAEGVFDSLANAGDALGSRRVLLGIGGDRAAYEAQLPFTLSLRGASAIAANFAGTPDQQSEVQAHLAQDGAGWAVVMTPGASDELSAVVAQGLDGLSSAPLSDLTFALGSATLTPAARSVLDHLALVLTRTFPSATAVINGYTDSLGGPGTSNELLSLARAQAALRYLTARGVTSDRLQAVGHGPSDPRLPEGSAGQPSNRRVVIVINWTR